MFKPTNILPRLGDRIAVPMPAGTALRSTYQAKRYARPGAVVPAHKAIKAARAHLEEKPNSPLFPIHFGRGYGTNEMSESGDLWIEDPEHCGLRFAGHADELARISHKGWYVDSFQSETVRGAVWRMAARNGESRFVAGYLDPYNEGPARINFHDIYSDETGAAYAGDSMAEKYAEESREYNDAWQAGREYHEKREEWKENRTLVSDLLRECRTARDIPADMFKTLRKVTHNSIRAARRDMRELANDARGLREEWTQTWRGESIVSAFRDGAQL